MKTEKTLVNDAIQVFVTLTVTVDNDDPQREIDRFLEQNSNRKPKLKPEPVVEQLAPPSSVEKIIDRSITLEKRSDFKGALKLLTDAVEYYSDNQLVFFIRGDIYNSHFRDYDAAIVDYTKAIELASNNGLLSKTCHNISKLW